jgi:hypothetical protein
VKSAGKKISDNSLSPRVRDDPEQSKRFIDMAREVGAEKPSPNFERVFRKVAEQTKGFPPKPSVPAKGRRSPGDA